MGAQWIHIFLLWRQVQCVGKKCLSKNMPLLSIRLHTSSWLCTDTGDTVRRLGVQTATSLSQTADGAGFLTHPKEPSSVMTAVNSDLKIIKYCPLVGRMERFPFVGITTDTQSCTYSVESMKTARRGGVRERRKSWRQ